MFSKTFYGIALVFLVAASAAQQTVAAPATPYPAAFRVDPLVALQQAAALAARTGKPPVSATEFTFLQDAHQGRLSRWSMSEAALIVAGIDDSERPSYLAKLESLAQQSQVALANADTPQAKATALTQFLLKGPMSAGYVSGQYDLRKLLDTGRFNCVSSAILFNILARRNGLQTGAVTLPRHVFSRIAGFDIEPTSGGVFPAADRESRVLKNRKPEDDKEGGAFARRLYRDVDNMGLLSQAYYDEGCELAEQERYSEAVVAYLKCACLDSDDGSMTRNLHSAFTRWFNLSLKNKRYSEAATVARLYRQLLREPTKSDWMADAVARAAR